MKPALHSRLPSYSRKFIQLQKLLKVSSFVLMPGLAFWSATSAHAASGTWNGGSGNWATGTWTPSTPGATTGTTNTDVATLNTGTGTLTVDTGRNVKSITFDGGVGSYTLSGGSLVLTTGGTTQLASTVTSTGQVMAISTPISLAGNYTFANNAATNDTLTLGSITHSVASLTTTTLGGANTGANTVSGVISDNGVNKMALSKAGLGTWILAGANTYTGTTSIAGGTLKIDSSTGSTATGNALSMNGGSFVYGSSNATGTKSQTLGTVSSLSGFNTIENDETGAGSSTLTIGTFSRASGSVVNFVTTGGATIVSTPGFSFNPGTYLNGTDYAVASAGGAISPIVYGTTANTGVVSGSATLTQNFDYLLSGNTSIVNTNLTAGTLKFGGSYTLTNGGTTTLGGFLVTGGNTAIVTGGVLRGNLDFAVRTHASNDSLTLNPSLVNFSTGAVVVMKSGAGTLTMAGSNTYSGNTSVYEGTLKTTHSNGLGFGGQQGGTLNSYGTTQVSPNATLDLSSSTASLTVNEPIILTNASLINSSATNTTTIDNGVAAISLTAVGTGYTSAPTLTFSSGTAAGTLTASGTTFAVNTQQLTSAGTGYTTAPTITISGGGGSGATATAILSSIALNGTNTIGGAGALVIKAQITDGTTSGGLNKTGAGTLTLSGANSYTGGTTVSGGTIKLTTGGTLGATTGSLGVAGGTLDLNGVNATVGAVTLGGGTIAATSAAILTTSGITVNGTGNTIKSGTTLVGNVSQGAGSSLAVNGTIGNNSLASGASLSGTGTAGAITLAGNNTLGSSSTLTTGGITVNGTGNSISTGTVTGNTTINSSAALNVAGTLSGSTVTGGLLNGSGSTGAVTVSGGGTIGGTLTTGALTVQNGGTVSPGNSPGTLSSASATFESGGSYLLQMNNDGSTGAAGANWDKLALSGNLDVSSLSSSNPFTLTLQTLTATNVTGLLASFDASTNHTWTSVISSNGVTGTFDPSLFMVNTTGFQNAFSGTFALVQDAGNLNNLDLIYVAVVPEPGTWALMLGSLATLLVVTKRRNSLMAPQLK